VARISDADPEMLRYFDTVGIALDSHVTVLARRDFAGTVSVAIDEGHGGDSANRTLELGSPAAESIWVVPC
jgi:DtxR family Mn-dependent transcriptional regulator